MPLQDNDRSLAVKTVASVFMSVAAVAVILRCYVRGFVIKAFGWDDAVMVLAMLMYAMFSACMIGGTLHGTGHKFAELTADQRVTAMEYWWLCEIAYCFSSVGCKISVCIFLLRITVKRVHIWILYTVMALTVLTGLVFMFIMLLQCKPLEYFWTRTALDPNIKGSCISIEIVINMTYVYSAFAALCDFTVGILPIFLVAKLHMRRQTKFAVVGILSMACIASSAVIVRIPFVKTFRDEDFLWATIEIAIWSNIESGLGITAGSLATLRPLLRHWLGSSHDASYTRGTPSPFPGRSGSRLPGALSGRDHVYPLGSMDDSAGRLRPDKLAMTVTTIQTHHDNSSEERLTTENVRPGHGGHGHGRDGRHGHGGGGASTPPRDELGMGIHQVIEVTQTSEVGGAKVREAV
ncbi:putative integral membrane protein [Aspergillus stella-maris]|uniref:putative integral membrane protein n=1 Tax=Aspergillus stella-maris TaxID=1810926 RepID=UPI003CCDE58E